MPQTNLKRLLGYSSIAHAGYLLIGVASFWGGPAGPAIAFYLAGYLLMTFLAFLVLQQVAKASGSEEISDFNGLGTRSPLLALGMLVSMLSLGRPPVHRRLPGQVSYFRGGDAQPSIRPGSDRRSDRRLRLLLLSEGSPGHVLATRSGWRADHSRGGLDQVSDRFFLRRNNLFLGIFPQPLLAMLQ